MPDIFLSYSRDDQVTARRFAEALKSEGFSVWWDQSLSAGEAFDRVTEKALDEARAVVVLWSRRSVESDWVRAEATQARANDKLVPVMIEPCKRPIMFELTHTAELSNWKGDANDPAWRTYVADVRRFVHKDETGTAPASAASNDLHRSPRRTGLIWTAAVAALAIGAGLFWYAQSRNADTPAVTSRTTPAVEASIAVLPFANMSSDPEQEYFADGLSEELLNHLAQVPDLRVVGRTSSFAFKGRNEDLRKIGEILGVNHLLEGSVRKAGNRVKVSAQLINTADGSHVWSETYERTLDDIFAIQDEIARTVAAQMKLTLGVKDFNAGGTKNVAAYDEFLAGRALMNAVDARSVMLGLPHLERAVALDPSYLNARLWLVEALSRAFFFAPNTSARLISSQEQAIDEIAGLAPGTPEASLAQSYRGFRGNDLAELERLLKNALLVPGGAGMQARLRYGRFLLGVGQLANARSETERFLRDDPLDAFAQVQLYLILEAAMEFERAEVEVEKLRQIPGGKTLETLGGRVNLAQSRRDVAALQLAAGNLVAARAGMPFVRELVKMPMQDYARARRIIREQFAATGLPKDSALLVRIAQWAEFFDDRELALQSMEALRAAHPTFDSMADNFWRPILSGLRSTPVFRELLTELGVVDYWRQTGNWGDFCKPVGETDFECN